uniref:Uncharacterized protein n=1 Tax=Sciurus vulgaris TaxID=55149 RepID=A0A8D2DIN0_SCIVU
MWSSGVGLWLRNIGCARKKENDVVYCILFCLARGEPCSHKYSIILSLNQWLSKFLFFNICSSIQVAVCSSTHKGCIVEKQEPLYASFNEIA